MNIKSLIRDWKHFGLRENIGMAFQLLLILLYKLFHKSERGASK